MTVPVDPSAPNGFTAGEVASAAAVDARFDALFDWADGEVDVDNCTAGFLTTAAPAFVTALPGAPADGTEVYYRASDSAGAVWHLKYRSAATGSYKWLVLGGAGLFAEVTTLESTSSASYAALATAGPSITVPLAGDYDVTIGMRAYNDTATRGAIMSYDIGGTGAANADSINYTVGTGVSVGNISATRRKTGLAASTALVAKYKTTGSGIAYFEQRFMLVRPVRVG